jgi:tetratricopeptide (TPR) repeat protein/G:T-mismatch repair DNA endonuclease (very short patch repair protein)
MLLTAIAGYFKLKYQHFRRLDDLRERLRLCEEALDLLEAGDPQKNTVLGEIADVYTRLYVRVNREEDLAQALEIFRRLTGASDPGFEILQGLGETLLYRFRSRGQLPELEEAVHTLQLALEECSDDPDMRSSVLRIYGQALRELSEQKGCISLARRAVEVLREAVVSRSFGHFTNYRAMGDLSAALSWLAAETDDATLADEAVHLAEETLKLCAPDSVEHQIVLQILGVSLTERFERRKDLASLQQALDILRQSLHLTTDNCSDRHRASCYHDLGVALLEHHKYTGSVKSLTDGIYNLRQALALRPIGQINRVNSLSCLASALMNHFHRAGDISSLEDSIQYQEQALSMRPPTHSRRLNALSNLGMALEARAVVTGDISSLQSSVKILREVLEACPEGHPRHVQVTEKLALSLVTYYRQSRDAQLLQEALNLQEHALSSRPVGNPERHTSLEHVASTLIDNFRRTKDDRLLYRAIELEREALELTPPGRPERERTLANLACGLRLLAIHTKSSDNAQQALDVALQFLDSLGNGHPDRPVALSELARLHAVSSAPFYSLSISAQYLSAAITEPADKVQQKFRRALADLRRIEHVSTMEVDAFHVDTHLRPTLLDAYRNTIELLPRVAYFGLDLSERLAALRSSESLGGDAAMHALVMGQIDLAVELQEASRAIFWSQALHLRTPFEDLPVDIAEKLKTLSLALEMGSYQHDDAEAQGWEVEGFIRHRTATAKRTYHDPDAVRRRRQSKEFEDLVAHVRTLPGFDRFLLHDVFSKLKQAARRGPLVILTSNKKRCHAIVVQSTSDTASHIELPLLNASVLRRIGEEVRESNLRGMEHVTIASDDPVLDYDGATWAERRARTAKSPSSKAEIILARLWQNIVRPVADHLALKVGLSLYIPKLILTRNKASGII